MKKQFKKFMKKRDAWKKFKKRCDSPWEKFKKIAPSDKYILRAFTWSGSKEGHEFWDKLNVKWQKYIRINNLI